MTAGPPALPWDQFPVAVRFVGRATVGELWRGCYEAGRAVGWAEGLAVGILGTSALVALLLTLFLAVRSRR